MKLKEYVSGDWDQNLNVIQRIRASDLVLALEQSGCVGLRWDSLLCWQYIYKGKFLNQKYNCVDKIAKRMKKLEFFYGLPNNMYISTKKNLLNRYCDEYRAAGISIKKRILHQIVQDEVEDWLFQMYK